MMINIKNKSECCGCGACYNACTTNNIMMQEDEYGFKYPKVDLEKCTNCGLCEKVCPRESKSKEIYETSIAYAAYNKNEEIRKQSSSGGVFTLIAEKILEHGGVVFGAQFDENFNVVHSYVENIESVKKFRISKYVQSDIGESYRSVKKFLKKDKKVLFTGTPCQIEGLKSYLQKDYSNLYTQDIICHGVPSQKVWKKYKEYREKIDGNVPKNINFRDKEESWKKYSVIFTYDYKRYRANHTDDLYMQAFLKNVSLRESCYNCEFKKISRISDITLGDFWGAQNIVPEMDDDRGLSLIIIHSEKGRQLFKNIQSNMIFKEVELHKSIENNPSMTKSVVPDPNRKKFFENLDKMPFDELVKKYTYKPSFARKVINKVKYEFSKVTKNR